MRDHAKNISIIDGVKFKWNMNFLKFNAHKKKNCLNFTYEYQFDLSINIFIFFFIWCCMISDTEAHKYFKDNEI